MVKGNSTVPVGVEVGGGGLVGHVGLYLLGRFADRLGVGEVLSAPFGSGDGLVHDRGAVLVHAMLMPAGGGEACTDVEFLRSEPGLFGRVGSDSTLYPTMRSIDSGIRAGLGEGMATVRERVWDRLSTDAVVVLDIDSSLHEVHTESKQGTGPTYKGGWGFHPMYCFSDYTGECLAAELRRGNATANQVSDLVGVLDAAIAALPDPIGVGHRAGDDPRLAARRVRVRTDSAGGPSFAAACRLRNIGFAVVASKTDDIEAALGQLDVNDRRWVPALPPKPNKQKPKRKQTNKRKKTKRKKRRAHVIDLTDEVDTSSRPKGTRLIVRREPKHPGAQRSLFPAHDYRYWGHWTDSEASAARTDADMRAHARVENNIARIKDSGAGRFPFHDLDANRAWPALVTWADTLVRWFQHLCLGGTRLARAKPKTLRRQLWHTPARLVHHARRTTIRIPHTWPTAPLIAVTHQHILQL